MKFINLASKGKESKLELLTLELTIDTLLLVLGTYCSHSKMVVHSERALELF
jgi:hypothetical protein